MCCNDKNVTKARTWLWMKIHFERNEFWFETFDFMKLKMMKHGKQLTWKHDHTFSIRSDAF